MADAWRAYLEMALGLAEVPRKKAQQVAGDLVSKGGATAGQLQGLVEDVLTAGLANREALTKIVRFEVDRALGVVGLATADEVTELTDRVRDLERQLRRAQNRVTAAESASGSPVPDSAAVRHAGRDDIPAPVPGTTTLPAKKAVAKKVAKKAVAKKAAPAPSAQATTASVADAAATPERPAPVADAAPMPGAPPVNTAPAKKAATKRPAAKAATSDGIVAPAKRTPANTTTRKATTPSAKQGNARGPRSGDTGPASPDSSAPSVPPRPEPPRFEAPGDPEPKP